MRNCKRIILALLTAAATPAVIVWVLMLMDEFEHSVGLKQALQIACVPAIFAFVIALAYAIILGLPAYFLAKRFHLTDWWMSVICGFMIGAVPSAIYSWPLSHVNGVSSAWNGKEMVDYIINGTPTMAGWLRYIYSFCGMGLLGMLSGFTAWLVWRYLSSPKHNQT